MPSFSRVIYAVLFVAAIVGGGVSDCLWAVEPVTAPRDTPMGELHNAVAKVIYPNRVDPSGLRDLSIQAQLEPGPFTVPEGYVVTKLRYHFADPKTGFEHDKVTATTIYSVTERRYITEAKNNPNIILPAGDYKVVCGGLPEATGVLTYTLIRKDLVQPPPTDTQTTPGDNNSNRRPPTANVPPPTVKIPPETTGRPTDSPGGTVGGTSDAVSLTAIYQPVHLPQKYIPTGYRYYPGEEIPAGDPPIGEGSQSLWYGIPLQKKGGKPSSSSTEHPYTVYIDGISVYKNLASAKAMYKLQADHAKDRGDVRFGDEAYFDFKGDDGSMFKEYRGEKQEIFRRDLNVRNIRVGRVIFGLRIVGSQVTDFIRRPVKNQDFIAHATPTREELTQIAEHFISRIREYSNEKGWLHD